MPVVVLPRAPPNIDSIAVVVNDGQVVVSGTASDPNNDITSVEIVIVRRLRRIRPEGVPSRPAG